jgi:hypothetical protein
VTGGDGGGQCCPKGVVTCDNSASGRGDQRYGMRVGMRDRGARSWATWANGGSKTALGKHCSDGPAHIPWFNLFFSKISTTPNLQNTKLYLLSSNIFQTFHLGRSSNSK